MTDFERMVEMLDTAHVGYIMGKGEHNEEYIDLPGGTRLYFDEDGALIEAV